MPKLWCFNGRHKAPTLNPIENMWAEMKAMARRRDSPPSNIQVHEKCDE
ncbi:6398_t:CDS:1, partial [Ambispora leptoticha]